MKSVTTDRLCSAVALWATDFNGKDAELLLPMRCRSYPK